MTMLEQNEVSDLAKLLCARDQDGRATLRIGLLVTMYVTEPWTRPVREAVTDAAEEYIRQFRAHFKWAESSTGHMHPIDRGKVPFPREWLPQHDDGKSWFFGFHGGESEKAVGEFQISGYGPNNVKKGLGYLQVHLPLTWFAEHPEDTLPEFVLRMAKRLHPLSGYAGIGVQEILDFYSRMPFQVTVRQLGERFPGLEIEHCVGHGNYLSNGIKGVNWLTLFGDRWVQEIGGLDFLKVRLGEDFKLSPYDGGVMIQAGPKPEIGDVTANRWPRHYVTLARVLKPIQIKNHRPFHWGDGMGVQKSMDHAASLAWLFRFDGK